MFSLAQHLLAGGGGSMQLAQLFADAATELPSSFSSAKTAKTIPFFTQLVSVLFP